MRSTSSSTPSAAQVSCRSDRRKQSHGSYTALIIACCPLASSPSPTPSPNPSLSLTPLSLTHTSLSLTSLSFTSLTHLSTLFAGRYQLHVGLAGHSGHGSTASASSSSTTSSALALPGSPYEVTHAEPRPPDQPCSLRSLLLACHMPSAPCARLLPALACSLRSPAPCARPL